MSAVILEFRHVLYSAILQCNEWPLMNGMSILNEKQYNDNTLTVLSIRDKNIATITDCFTKCF